MDLRGVDVFYGGSTDKERAMATGLFVSAILELEAGRIPFPNGTFDLVLSNQVFEHVEDLDFVLAEIARVLKPSGHLLALFPSADIIREGHCGIPLLHWFPKGSRIRYYYGLALRSMGMGYFTRGKSRRQWVADFLIWLDQYTFYRPRREILRSFGRHYSVKFVERSLIKHRAERTRLAGWIRRGVDVPIIGHVGVAVFRRLAGLAMVAHRLGGACTTQTSRTPASCAREASSV